MPSAIVYIDEDRRGVQNYFLKRKKESQHEKIVNKNLS